VRRFKLFGKGGRSANFKIIFVLVGNKVLCTFTLCLSLFTRALRECESVCASDCWHAQHFGGPSGIDERIDARIVARIDARNRRVDRRADWRADRRTDRRAWSTSGSTRGIDARDRRADRRVCERDGDDVSRFCIGLCGCYEICGGCRRFGRRPACPVKEMTSRDAGGRSEGVRRTDCPRGAARFEGGDDAPRGWARCKDRALGRAASPISGVIAKSIPISLW